MAVSSALFLLFLITTLFCASLNGQLADILTPTHTLADDGTLTLISAAGIFELGFFSPDGSDDRYVGIWYHSISAKTVVWVANRRRPITGSSGRLSLTPNGTLIITDKNSTVVVWSSNSLAFKEPVARLLDDGNFVVEEAASGSGGGNTGYGWQSFDFPTNTLLPGMKLGWNLTTGFSRNLTAWWSAADPAPGEYVAGLDMQGQLFVWRGTREYWRGGPWNGLRFSGVPEMTPMNVIHVDYEFVADAHQVIYWFAMTNTSAISILVMDPSGTLKRFVWVGGSWVLFGSQPLAADPCERVSPCGPNAFCRSDGSPICECLPEFHPKNQENWDLEDWSAGCTIETTTLTDCHNRTDGFVALRGAKLPDASGSTVNWSLSLSLEHCRGLCLRNCSCTAYAVANISGSGSGCRIWTGELTDLTVYTTVPGQDLYVRQVAAGAVSESGHAHRRRNLVVIIVVVPALAIFLLACAACCVRRKERRRSMDRKTGEQELDLPLFDLSTIVDATDNFSPDNKLGQGGFGPVYKGKLEKGQEIAVKRLSESSTQGTNEFKNELVLIAKLQHRNLVRLLGCCNQKGERMLIYEYMSNGSLDAFLFDEARGALLDWPTRYKIILGIARGILYLHHDSRLRIIHRDLKASNVLLDKDMNPKISDFGMARICRVDDIEANTRRVVGTYGYMSPEYAMQGIFSVKSDVFSFGVLVLEIISGRKNRGVYRSPPHLNLLSHIWSLWQEEKPLELVDGSIRQSSSVTEIMRCIKIGLLCVQERPRDRPTMYSIVKMLDSDSALLPEPKQPGFVDLRRPFETDSSTSKQNLSINSISITMLEAR